MDKYTLNIFIIIIITFFVSCKNVQKKEVESPLMRDLNQKYYYALNCFNDPLTTHFPDRIDSLNITFTEGLASADIIGNLELIVINRVCNGNLINSKETYKKTYNADDSCLFVVNEHVNMQNHHDIKLLRKYQQEFKYKGICNDSLYPVPNFWHNPYTTDSTLSKLPNDFVLYVIDAKSGKFLDKELLSTGKSMPDKWKNGFSRGYAISKKQNVIIYWLIVW